MASSKRVKAVQNALGGAVGKMRESRWEHGTLHSAVDQLSTHPIQVVDLDLSSNSNATIGLGLGAPISLSLNPRSILSSSLDLPFVPSSSSAAASANDDLLRPTAKSSPTRSIPSLESATFDPSSFSALGSLGSSRRHSRLGMLKHRNKSLLSNASSPGSIVKDLDSAQHPRSPSIDITSVFPQAEPGAGASDAFQLFEEAFPYPATTDEATEKAITSPLVKLLSSPSIPTTLPNVGSKPASSSRTNVAVEAQATATADVKGEDSRTVQSRPSSVGSVKGLKELELVKRRLSWDSVTSNATPKATLVPGEDDVLTDEEKFQDALEDDEQQQPVSLGPSLEFLTTLTDCGANLGHPAYSAATISDPSFITSTNCRDLTCRHLVSPDHNGRHPLARTRARNRSRCVFVVVRGRPGTVASHREVSAVEHAAFARGAARTFAL